MDRKAALTGLKKAAVSRPSELNAPPVSELQALLSVSCKLIISEICFIDRGGHPRRQPDQKRRLHL